MCGVCMSGLWVCSMSSWVMGAGYGLGVHAYASVHSVWLVNERLMQCTYVEVGILWLESKSS